MFAVYAFCTRYEGLAGIKYDIYAGISAGAEVAYIYFYLTFVPVKGIYMIVDDKLIDKLAELSKLEFDAAEKVEIRKDLEKILTFMEQLNAIDTENVEPLIYVNDTVNVFREDVVHHPITKEEALSNAPLHDSDYIKVPKFVTHRS